MKKTIALVVLTLVVVLTYINRAKAGGPWNDQYCDVEVIKIKVVDQKSNLIEERVEEKVTCNDGASDFLNLNTGHSYSNLKLNIHYCHLSMLSTSTSTDSNIPFIGTSGFLIITLQV